MRYLLYCVNLCFVLHCAYSQDARPNAKFQTTTWDGPKPLQTHFQNWFKDVGLSVYLPICPSVCFILCRVTSDNFQTFWWNLLWWINFVPRVETVRNGLDCIIFTTSPHIGPYFGKQSKKIYHFQHFAMKINAMFYSGILNERAKLP